MQAPRSRVELTAEMISAVNSTWPLHLRVSEAGDVVEIRTGKGACLAAFLAEPWPGACREKRHAGAGKGGIMAFLGLCVGGGSSAGTVQNYSPHGRFGCGCWKGRNYGRFGTNRGQVEFTAESISAVNSTWLLHPWVSEGGHVVEIPAEKGAGKHKHCAKLGLKFV